MFKKCKLYIQVLGYVLYAAIMLPKFYKITSLETKKKIIQVFSKQHDFASQDSLVVGSNCWGVCGVAGTSPASKGGGVSVTPRVPVQPEWRIRTESGTRDQIYTGTLYLNN